MTDKPVGEDFRVPLWKRSAADPDNRNEDGISLIELLIVCLVLPLVLGGIATALVSVLSLNGGVSNRVSDSADAEVVSSHFENDVEGAASLTTLASATPCGSGTQLLGLEWSQTVVSYSRLDTTSPSSLLRNVCSVANGVLTLKSSTTVSLDIASGQGQPGPTVTIVPPTSSSSASTGWTSTIGVTDVSLSVTEPNSSYSYTLEALPDASPSSSGASTISSPTTHCGFATPGTGTYTPGTGTNQPTLCFVDFTNFAPPKTGCQTMTAGIVNTPYTMSFCITSSGGPVAGAPTPTYFDAPQSEAFLGNNGFYTGIPGDAALYQTTQGTTSTITVTNINVSDSNGNPATGWNLVTGDAESTDPDESITFVSDEKLTLLDNTPTSPYGNACAEPTPTDPSAVYLLGVGTTKVTCAATVQSDKTGTVMVQASMPKTLTVTLVGDGLQAMFLGLLLP